MKTIKLINDDITIENGDFVLTDEDTEQSVYIVLKSGKGEWFFNNSLGINRTNVLGKVTDEQVRNEIINGLSQEPTIRLIEEISIERSERSATVTFKGIKENGELTEAEVII